MNPELPLDPRQALEASLTALLLGELPEDQAAFLRQILAQDQELARMYEQLKRTIDLVSETARTSTGDDVNLREPPRLSEERKQELLQRFKTVAPHQFVQLPREKVSWFLPAAAAAGIVFILGGLLLPGLSRSKSRSMRELESTTFSAQHFLSEPVNRNGRIVTGESEQLRYQPTESAERDPGLNGLLAFDAARATGFGGTTTKGTIALPSIPGSTAPSLASASDVSSIVSSREDLVALFSTGPLGTDGKATGLIGRVDQVPAVSLGMTNGHNGAGLALGFLDAKNDGEMNTGLNEAQYLPRFAYSSESVGGGLGGAGAHPGKPASSVSLADEPAVERGLFKQTTGVASAPTPSNEAAGRIYADSYQRLAETPQLKDDFQLAPGSVAQAVDSKTGLTPEAPGLGLPAQNSSVAANAPTVAGAVVELPTGAGFSADARVNGFGLQGGNAAQDRPEVSQLSATPPVLGDSPVFGELFRSKLSVAGGGLKTDVGVSGSERRKANRDTADKEKTIASARQPVDRLEEGLRPDNLDLPLGKPAVVAPVPQPEIRAAENNFSTFSLNVSDVSFKLAAASLEKGAMPDPASLRSEEFLNAFDYHDPEAPAGVPIAFAWERAHYPFAQNRDVLRFSLKTAAQGRQPGRPLNLVLLLDNSGSMERADRVRIIHEALRVLATQLQPQDTFSVIAFARTPRLVVDGVPGNQAGRVVEEVGKLTPQGGTNLEEAMNLAYQTAVRHYFVNGMNRVVLLTDGAANLGNVEPEALKKKVEDHRKQGIAFDCFGIGWEGYNDDLLAILSRNGDGRYGFINTPEEATTEFAGKLAGALNVAASDVKVQVEFNPSRVTAYRQVGYAKHQLAKEQFRDNTVDAAEIGAAESGNALYVIEINPGGSGSLAVVRVRYKVPGTTEYQEREWTVPYSGSVGGLEQASPSLRLAASASAFAEWLSASPFASEVKADRLLGYLGGVPAVYGADGRPKQLEWMIRQAKALNGK